LDSIINPDSNPITLGPSSITGSFVYDADTQVFSSIDLFSTLGGADNVILGKLRGSS
jgi:hypothetical protein